MTLPNGSFYPGGQLSTLKLLCRVTPRMLCGHEFPATGIRGEKVVTQPFAKQNKAENHKAENQKEKSQPAWPRSPWLALPLLRQLC